MKFKTQKEVKEEAQDENKSNPIHEYLDYVSYGIKQLAVLQTNKTAKIYIVAPHVDLSALEQIFNWKDTKEHKLIYRGDSGAYITTAFEVYSTWIDHYNKVADQVEAFEAQLLSHTLPGTCSLANVMQAYRDLQENPEEAKKKWFKCE